ncbi:unnamed protein product [Sphagnum jensenii]|uniref:Uncharacterized protein n=2 Tax=Sphagnum jensenii TaxID=128206 RepID=A0ABP1BLK4_9BRYO
MFFSQGTSRNPTAKSCYNFPPKKKESIKLWNKHQDLMIHTRRHHHQAMERNTNQIAYNLSLESHVLVQKKPTQESGDKSFEHKRSDGGEGSGAVRGGNPSLVTAITSLLRKCLWNEADADGSRGKISRSWLRESSRGMQNKQLVQRDRATARWGRGERSCKAHNFPSRNTTLVNSSANGKALTSLGAPRIAMSAFHSARRYGVSRLLSIMAGKLLHRTKRREKREGPSLA